MKYLAESDPSFFKEFKLRILGSVFLYQIFRLIEFSVPVPLPKANRMKKMNIDFIIRPNNSKAVLYTMELRTNNQYENGNIIVYFPQILRVKDTQSLLENSSYRSLLDKRPIGAVLERIVFVNPQKNRKRKNPSPKKTAII